MSATLSDICEKTGYSKATVSRVLNNSPKVKPHTAKKVREVMKELNYKPNHVARNLSLNRTGVIGVILPGITSGFLAEIIHGIEKYLSSNDLQLLLTISDGKPNIFTEDHVLFSEMRTDGLIILDPLLAAQRKQFLESQSMPIVLLQNREVSNKLISVSVDDVTGGYVVTKHLIEKGCKNIWAVTGPTGSPDSDGRLEGYKKALKEHGMAFNPDNLLIGTFTSQATLIRFKEKFDGNTDNTPDGIFAFNDDMAVNIMKHLMENGLKIPSDIAIAGYDGSVLSDLGNVTSYNTFPTRLGMKAAEAIRNKIQDPDSPTENIIMQGELIERESSI